MKNAPIYPLGDRLKILPLVPPEKTKGGIVIPETADARDRPLEGLVMAVGCGRLLDSGRLMPLECEVGDVVQFGKYAGIHVFDAAVGFDVLLMREDEVLGRKKASEVGMCPVMEHCTATPVHVPGDPRCEASYAYDRLSS